MENTLGMRGRGEVRALGLVNSPKGLLRLLLLIGTFMGWSFNEPGNPGDVFVLLCPFKGAFDAPGFVLGTMMSSITFGAAF